MRRIDLAIAERADDEEILGLGMREHVLEQRETGGIGPLQVVEKERERVLALGKHADEALERRMESVLPLDRRQIRYGGLRPEEQF